MHGPLSLTGNNPKAKSLILIEMQDYRRRGKMHLFWEKCQQEAANKNMLSGHTEPSHLNEFQFELQRRTFHSYGFAQDPSSTGEDKDELIGKYDQVS